MQDPDNSLDNSEETDNKRKGLIIKKSFDEYFQDKMIKKDEKLCYVIYIILSLPWKEIVNAYNVLSKIDLRDPLILSIIDQISNYKEEEISKFKIGEIIWNYIFFNFHNLGIRSYFAILGSHFKLQIDFSKEKSINEKEIYKIINSSVNNVDELFYHFIRIIFHGANLINETRVMCIKNFNFLFKSFKMDFKHNNTNNLSLFTKLLEFGFNVQIDYNTQELFYETLLSIFFDNEYLLGFTVKGVISSKYQSYGLIKFLLMILMKILNNPLKKSKLSEIKFSLQLLYYVEDLSTFLGENIMNHDFYKLFCLSILYLFFCGVLIDFNPPKIEDSNLVIEKVSSENVIEEVLNKYTTLRKGGFFRIIFKLLRLFLRS